MDANYIYDNFGDLVGQITARPGPGYDLVTGLGTPAANLLVPALVNGGTASASHVTPTPAASAPSGTSHLPGPQARTANSDSDSTQGALWANVTPASPSEAITAFSTLWGSSGAN